jgi:O-antigen/teichoic acid export membrane protein
LASNFEASGEHDKLRGLLRQGTRIAILVAWPIQIALLFRGETFIRLWMGPQYQHISGRVMQILLLSQLVTVANSTSINITLGLAKHRRTTYWAAGEAAVNFILSVFLARRIGIYGVAIGTVIPSLFVHLFLWPHYICKIVGVSLKEHLLQSWLKPVLAVVPFGMACYLTDRYWPSNRLIGFFLQIFAILPIYVVTVALSFRRDIMEQLRARTKWFARPAVAAGEN